METLEALLEEVRAALRRADFKRLAQLTPAIEAASATLDPSIGREALLRLREESATNAALLEAARRGIRAARRRVEEARSATRSLQTYDNTGKRADILAAGLTAGRF